MKAMLTVGLLGLFMGGIVTTATSQTAPSQGKEPAPSKLASDGFPWPEGALHRFGNRQLRHADGIRQAAVSPDGKLLATQGSRTIVVWDLATLTAKRVIEPHAGLKTDYVQASANLLFSADSKMLYTTVYERDDDGHLRHNIRAFDVQRGEPLFMASIDLAYQLAVLWLTNQGKELAVASRSKVFYFDAQGGKLLNTVVFPQPNTTKPMDVGGDRVLELSQNRGPKLELLVRDARKGDLIHMVEVERVLDSTISPDGKLIAFHQSSGQIHVHDVTAKKELYSFEHPSPAKKEVGHLRFTRDGKTLYVGSKWGHIYRCEVKANPKAELLGRHNMWNLTGLTLSADEKTLFSTSMDRLVRRWDLTTNKELTMPDGYITRTCFALSRDGKHIMVADHQGQVDYWNLNTGEREKTLQPTNTGGINTATLTVDGRYLIAGRTQADVRLFDLAKQQKERDFPIGDNKNPANSIHVQRVGSSPDGTLIYGGSYPTGVTAWERATGKVVWNNPTACGTMTVDPKGRWLAISGFTREDGTMPIIVVDAATGKELHKITPLRTDGNPPSEYGTPAVSELCAMPDGSRLIAVLTDGTFRHIDVQTGQDLGHGRHRAGYNWVASVSADGRYLAIAGSDYVVNVWELTTNSIVATFKGHQSAVTQVEFTRNGRGLVSSADLSPVLWDLKPSTLPTLPDNLDAAWQTLAEGSPKDAYALQWALVNQPAKALSLAKDRIHPAEWTLARKDYDQLLASLDQPRFAVREKAEKDLRSAGGKIPLAWLRASYRDSTSEEVRTRVGRIITDREKSPDLPARRLGRLVYVLEQINTPASNELLREWAKSTAGLPALEAQAALQRRGD